MDTQTRVTEVALGIHQLTTVIPDAPVAFNQYLIAAAEPLLFHTGMRGLFPLVAAGVSTVVAPETLRWVSFGHVEADESGSMNEWLALAPQASVAHGFIGCMVSIGDLADRPPRALADGETMDIGGHVVQWFDTPHVPHAWEAGVMCSRGADRAHCCWGRGGFSPTPVENPPHPLTFGPIQHLAAPKGPTFDSSLRRHPDRYTRGTPRRSSRPPTTSRRPTASGRPRIPSKYRGTITRL